MGCPAAPALCLAIDSASPQVRLAAVQVLGRIGDPAATTTLCNTLADCPLGTLPVAAEPPATEPTLLPRPAWEAP